MSASVAEQAALTWAERVRAAQPEAPKPKIRLALAPSGPVEPRVDDFVRPKRRVDCEEDERPCPWVSCRHHLYLDVLRKTEIHTTTTLEVWEMDETCSLDLAARDGMTLEEVSAIFGVSRERIRQIEDKALRKIKRIEEKRRKASALVEEARLLGLVKPSTRRHTARATTPGAPDAPEPAEWLDDTNDEEDEPSDAP